MDFKSLLQTMDNISETVHKAGPGGYGNRHGSETQTDQYGKPIGKVSLASLAPKDDKPKSRGRPVDPDKPKTGKDDPKNQKVGDLFGRTTGDVPKGKKGSQHTPMKDADKEEKKAEKKSLKDWIEVSEHNQLNEEDVSVKPIQASQIIGADGKSMGTADPATANAIKAAAEKGTLNLSGDDSSSSSSSTSSTSSQPMTEKSDKPVKTDASEKGKYKGKSKSELLKAFKHLKKTGPHEKDSTQYKNMKELAVAIRAKGDSDKVETKEKAVDESALQASFGYDKYGDGMKKLQDAGRRNASEKEMQNIRAEYSDKEEPVSEGGYNPDRDAEKEWDRYAQGDRDFQNRERNAGEEDDTPKYPRTSDRMRQAQQRHYGFKRPRSESIEEAKDLPGDQDELDVKKPFGELTRADFKALSKKKKVKEDRTMQILEGINFKELMASADSEVQEMLIELQDDVEMFKKTGHTSELIDSFLKVHLHHSKKRITDEAAGAGRGSVNPPAVNPSAPLPPARSAAPGWGRDDYKPLVPFDTSPKSSMGTIKGGVWTADPPKRGERGVPIPMDLEAVPEGNFLSTLGQSNKTFESKIMKDIQLESWEKELNSLLTVNEGITVSTSTGQQGSPDSVSVNATDGDSAELLQVLRQAGLGVFGGEEERSSYGSPMHSQEPTGAGSEPEMSPAVVGDGNDMMALLKKMSGIQDGGEPEGVAVVDVSSEEDEDENSHYGSDNHDHEEDEVDEGSEWTEKLKNTPKGGKFTIGGKEYTDTSSLEEEDRLISKANSNDGTISTSSSTGRIQATMGPNGISVSPKPGVQNGQDSNKKAQKQDESHDHEDHETCNECGMYEARCVCEPGEEQVEEAAKYRDPKYKDKLYTVEPLDYTYGPDADELYYNPKPDDYEGRKRKIGGSEFSHNDPLRKGYGRGGASNSINTHGKRKGMPSRDQISSLKGSIKDGHGTHPRPNLPEEQVEEDYANEAGHEEMASLKHLLNAGNDMHYPKEKQSVGNPTKVTFETKLLKDSTSLLQDFKKLSGIK
jgi:hypothetical protein